MFFLLRSAICITVVVVALSNRSDQTAARATLAAAPGQVSTLAGNMAERFCKAHCLTLAAGSLAGSLVSSASIKRRPRTPSRDTLLVEDLRPAWTGPITLASD